MNAARVSYVRGVAAALGVACVLAGEPWARGAEAVTNATRVASRPRPAGPRPPGVRPPPPPGMTANERAAWDARWDLLLERIALKRSLASATPAEREAALEAWEAGTAARVEGIARLEAEGARERATLVKAEREAALRSRSP